MDDQELLAQVLWEYRQENPGEEANSSPADDQHDGRIETYQSDPSLTGKLILNKIRYSRRISKNVFTQPLPKADISSEAINTQRRPLNIIFYSSKKNLAIKCFEEHFGVSCGEQER